MQKIVHNKGWRIIKELGSRGKILDCNNKELAISSKKYDFWVNTNKSLDKNKIIDLFSNSFNKEKKYYSQKLEKKTNYLRLEKNLQFLEDENSSSKYSAGFSLRPTSSLVTFFASRR